MLFFFLIKTPKKLNNAKQIHDQGQSETCVTQGHTLKIPAFLILNLSGMDIKINFAKRTCQRQNQSFIRF